MITALLSSELETCALLFLFLPLNKHAANVPGGFRIENYCVDVFFFFFFGGGGVNTPNFVVRNTCPISHDSQLIVHARASTRDAR